MGIYMDRFVEPQVMTHGVASPGPGGRDDCCHRRSFGSSKVLSKHTAAYGPHVTKRNKVSD